MPSGLAGALTLKSLPGGEANAPAPIFLPSEFVNAPETAMDEIRRTSGLACRRRAPAHENGAQVPARGVGAEHQE